MQIIAGGGAKKYLATVVQIRRDIQTAAASPRESGTLGIFLGGKPLIVRSKIEEKRPIQWQ